MPNNSCQDKNNTGNTCTLIYPEVQRILGTIIAKESNLLRLLDLGSGSGGAIFSLSKHFNVGEVYCVDFDEKALAECERKGFRCLKVDLEKCALPYSDKYFDIITMLEVLEHLGNPSKALSEAYRTLKNNGYIIITTPNLVSWRNRIRMVLGLYPENLALIPGELGISGIRNIKKEIAYHVRLYTPDSLKILLKYFGFDTVTVIGIPSKFYHWSKKHKLFIFLGFLDSILAKKPSFAWHLLVVARKQKSD